MAVLVRYEKLSKESVRASKFYSTKRTVEDFLRNHRNIDGDKEQAINQLLMEIGGYEDGFEIIDFVEIESEEGSDRLKYFKITLNDRFTGRSETFYVAQFSS